MPTEGKSKKATCPESDGGVNAMRGSARPQSASAYISVDPAVVPGSSALIEATQRLGVQLIADLIGKVTRAVLRWAKDHPVDRVHWLAEMSYPQCPDDIRREIVQAITDWIQHSGMEVNTNGDARAGVAPDNEAQGKVASAAAGSITGSASEVSSLDGASSQVGGFSSVATSSSVDDEWSLVANMGDVAERPMLVDLWDDLVLEELEESGK